MKDFKIEKKGYSINEVDDFIIMQQIDNDRALKDKQVRINELREENLQLSRELEKYKKKEESITLALTSATEKAKEIEDKARREYQLELKNLDLFYNKWNAFFNELIVRYPKMNDFDTNEVLQNIKSDINNLMCGNFKVEVPYERKDDFRDLLNKLRQHGQNKPKKKATLKINDNVNRDVIIDSENELEYLQQNNKINKIKPITNLSLSSEEKEEFENLVDKFLHSDNKISKGYENSILNSNKKSKYPKPNSSGFDFEEALNPTDDLYNILKGFKLD